MVPPPIALLAAALLISAASPVEGDGPQPTVAGSARVDPRLRIHTESVEPYAVQQGLELRVGEGWRRWSIDVADGSVPGQVQVQLRDEAGHVHTRALTLEGETLDERSRALASSLALLVEQIEDRTAEPTGPESRPEPAGSEPEPPRSQTSGFIGMGPRAALNPGRPVHWDAGASLAGGAWLAGDHVQPVAELAWARSTASELQVNALRLGAGVLGGAAGARGRLWSGGGALIRAQWAQARASGTAAGWWASPAVVGAIQYRAEILVVGLWLGADLSFPPLRARGDSHVLRWSMLRPMATLHMGIRLPPRPRKR